MSTRKMKVLAQIASSEIAKALEAKDILVGAEWEFIFNEKYVSLVPRKVVSEGREILENAAQRSIDIDPWLNQKAHTHEKIKGWKLEIDKSLPRDRGAELISPALSLQTFLQICPNIFRAISKVGTTTNQCGFHVSISLKYMFGVNPLKLALFVDEDLVYSLFNKEARSKYGGPVKDLLADILKRLSNIPGDITSEVEKVLEAKLQISLFHFLTKKYGINPGKLQKGYIEFRYMGGASYHKKWEAIKNIIGMYIAILKIANDKYYRREEYESKVLELIKDEIKAEKILIEDTKPWVKDIEAFLKNFNLELKKIQRSQEFIHVHVRGSREDIHKASEILQTSSSTNVLKIAASNSELKKVLESKKYVGVEKRFSIEDNVALDNLTGLMWSRDSLGSMPWKEAAEAARLSRLHGYKNWRLPMVDELKTLIVSGKNPAINTDVFRAPERQPFYWATTSTLVRGRPGMKDAVDFWTGEPLYDVMPHAHPVRIVRNA